MKNVGTILIDFDCIHRRYDHPVEFVLHEQPEIAEFIWRSIGAAYPDELWSTPGNSEFRRLLCWLGYIKGAGEYPEIDNVQEADRLKRTLSTIRELANEAKNSKSYENVCYPDFPHAAKAWLKDGFEVIVFSDCCGPDQMSLVIGSSGLSEQIACVNVPRHDGHGWAENLFKERGIDRNRSFLITTKTHFATEIRTNLNLKTAALDRNWVRKPYDEKGRYLSIGKLTDIDPLPKTTTLDQPISNDTSLSCFIRTVGEQDTEARRVIKNHEGYGVRIMVSG